MLWQRIATALPLMAVLLWSVIYGPAWLFVVLVLGFLYLGALEWCALSGLRRTPAVQIYSLSLVSGAGLLTQAPAPVVCAVAGAATIGWAVAIPLLAMYPGYRPGWSQAVFGKLLVGALVLLGAGASLPALNTLESGPWATLGLFFAIWLSDSGAYFVGRAFGRHKLLPQVSPGKTLEGLAGGIGLVLICGVLVVQVAPPPHSAAVLWLAVGIMAALFGVVGDLVESWIKREAGVKDSGGLLPGHGGVLDRVDSLCAAAPVMMLMLCFGQLCRSGAGS